MTYNMNVNVSKVSELIELNKANLLVKETYLKIDQYDIEFCHNIFDSFISDSIEKLKQELSQVWHNIIIDIKVDSVDSRKVYEFNNTRFEYHVEERENENVIILNKSWIDNGQMFMNMYEIDFNTYIKFLSNLEQPLVNSNVLPSYFFTKISYLENLKQIL